MIRTFLALGLSVLLSVAGAGKTSASGSVHVSGYTTKSGTVVAPYYRRAPGTATPSYSTPTYTAPTARSFSSCADARASGRWNILTSDPDYSPSLDRDSDGIACEAGSDGSSTERDSDPVGTVSTVGGSYTPPPWVILGQTYPEWLGQHLAWRSNSMVCTATAQAHQQAFLNDGTGAVPAWRGTVGFMADLPMAVDSQKIDVTNTANGVQSSSAWLTAGSTTLRRMWFPDSPETVFLAEMQPLGDNKATICISTLANR